MNPQHQDAPAYEETSRTEPGTSPRQQAEASLKKHRNPKRRRGSDDETQSRLITHWILYLRSPPKDKRNLSANTQNQTPRPHLTATIRPVMPGTRRRSRQMRHRKMCMPQRDSGPSGTTHGLQSREGSANQEQRKKSPPTPQGQAIYDHLVSRATTTPRTQPEPPSRLRQKTGGIDTPAENDYTPNFRVQPPTPANYGVLVGRETIALTPIEKYAATTPHIDTPKKYKKPKSGSDKKQKNTRSKSHRLP